MKTQAAVEEQANGLDSADFDGETVKQKRHNAIRELVKTFAIPNQDELRRRLIKHGFEVTQATLSRDVNELHLMKGPNGYSLPGNDSVPRGTAVLDAEEDSDEMPGVSEVLSAFGLRVRQAINQLILITTMGGAQPAAAAIDEQHWPEVLGTIAGDNTVLIICADERTATELRRQLEVMIG